MGVYSFVNFVFHVLSTSVKHKFRVRVDVKHVDKSKVGRIQCVKALGIENKLELFYHNQIQMCIKHY